MGSKVERLQNKHDRLVERSQRDGLLNQKEEERIAAAKQALDDAQKTEEISIDEQANIEEEVVADSTDKASNAVKESISLNQLLNKGTSCIRETRKQLRFIKRGEGTEVRNVVQYINERLDQAQALINKNKKYDRKFSDHDVRKNEHISAMITKIVTLLDNSRDYISQTVTGDIDEAKKFFPPNVFDDASDYVPDAQPHAKKKEKNDKIIGGYNGPVASSQDTSQKEYPGRKEALGDGGIIGGLNRVGAQTNMTLGQRKMFSNLANLGVTAGLVFGGYKVAKDIRGLIRGTKKFGFAEKDEDGKVISEGTPWLTGLMGGSLLTTMTLGKRPRQVVTEVAKGGETSKKIYGWLVDTQDNPEVSDEVKEGIGHAININTTIGLIPFMDLTKSGILTFNNKKPMIDKDKLDAYIDSDYAKSKYDSQDLENMKLGLKHYNTESLEKAFQQMNINEDTVKNNPNDLPSKYFMKYSEELAKKGEQEDTKVEGYNGDDQANIKPTLNAIETQLDSTDSSAFKGKKAEIEKQVNVLYSQYPKARPIKIAYDSATKTIDLTTYGETTKLDILSDIYVISTPYSDTARSVASIAEAFNIAAKVSLRTSKSGGYIGSSDFDTPFNLSRDGISADIQFGRISNLDAIKEMSPGRILDETLIDDNIWSSDFENTFPSINEHKKEFVAWVNGFQKDGESIRKKSATNT